MNKFLKLLREKSILLLDGAMGTNLFSKGLGSGDAPELWNLTKADIIREHYRSFIEVGSDLILTNSFGGNFYRLGLHNQENNIYDINFEGAKLFGISPSTAKSARDDLYSIMLSFLLS